MPKAQVRLNRRAARIKRWSDGQGAMLKVHPQVMPDDKQRHLSRGPADQAAERALRSRGRDLLEPQSGTSALAGVEPVERAATAPREPANRTDWPMGAEIMTISLTDPIRTPLIN